MRSTQQATTLCTFCPKLSRAACPVATAERNEATTPWAKMSVMKSIDDGRLPANRENFSLAYKCLNCRGSEAACEHHNPVSSTLDRYRIRAFGKGLAPESVHQFCQKFSKHQNPYNKDLGLKIRKLSNRWPVDLKRKIYFAGCTETFHSPETIAKTLTLLKKMGQTDIGLYPATPVSCCGYPLYVAGDWKGFVLHAKQVNQLLRRYEMILSGAPACLYTLETLYTQAGFPLPAKFLHSAQVLNQKMKNLPPHRMAAGRVTTGRVAYHDPCYLGRYRNVYEEPRALITAATGQPPLEFPSNRELSSCSGGGGLLPVSSPETAQIITESRLAEFRQTGADTLVSGCPTCVHRFKKCGKGKVRVMGLVELFE